MFYPSSKKTENPITVRKSVQALKGYSLCPNLCDLLSLLVSPKKNRMTHLYIK